jgi:hypothetical protein
MRRDNADRYSVMSTNQLKTGMHPTPEMSQVSNTFQAMSIVITGVHTEIILLPIFVVMQSCCNKQPWKPLHFTHFTTHTHKEHGSLLGLFSLSLIKENRLRMSHSTNCGRLRDPKYRSP